METWEAQLMILKRFVASKGVRWFWSNYREEFGESFQTEVAGILSAEGEMSDDL